MKILVKNQEHTVRLVLPTNLVFNSAVAWIADRACGAIKNEKLAHVSGCAADAITKLPPDAVSRLFAELRRIKRRYGSWELVDVQSADGETVKIIL